MPRKLRPATRADSQDIRSAIFDLRSAREKLARAGAVKAADYVRAALKSAEGAERHNERRIMHTPEGDHPVNVRVLRTYTGENSRRPGECPYCDRTAFERTVFYNLRSQPRGAPEYMLGSEVVACGRHAARAAAEALFADGKR
jgi:hypothetical protein